MEFKINDSMTLSYKYLTSLKSNQIKIKIDKRTIHLNYNNKDFKYKVSETIKRLKSIKDKDISVDGECLILSNRYFMFFNKDNISIYREINKNDNKLIYKDILSYNDIKISIINLINFFERVLSFIEDDDKDSVNINRIPLLTVDDIIKNFNPYNDDKLRNNIYNTINKLINLKDNNLLVVKNDGINSRCDKAFVYISYFSNNIKIGVGIQKEKSPDISLLSEHYYQVVAHNEKDGYLFKPIKKE